MSSISSGTTTTTGYVVSSDTTGALVLKTGSAATTAVTIDTSQNVGIGTGSPAYKLDVAGQFSRIGQSGGAGAGLIFAGASATKNWVIASQYNLSGTLEFTQTTAVGGSGISSTPSMVINGSGNVGIGVNSPAQKLEVLGNIYAQSGVFLAERGTAAAPGYAFFDDSNTGMFNVDNTDLCFSTQGGERMRIDSSGNVGIGTSAPNAPLDVRGNTGTSVSAVMRIRGTNTTARTTRLQFEDYAGTVADGLIDFKIPTAGSAASALFQLGINGPTITMDVNGNVGIGTSSPAHKLHVLSSSTTVTVAKFAATNYGNLGTTYIEIGTQNGDGGSRIGSINPTGNQSILVFETMTGTSGVFAERARIENNGSFLINCTSVPSGGSNSTAYDNTGDESWVGSSTGTGGSYKWKFYNGNGLVGSIVTSGSSTAFNTSSDYRLKENIAPMTGALATVAQLKPCTYTWKADGASGQGFIAHELAEVVPDCVSGDKDALDANGNIKPQGIDVSFLVATLTAAIQEQQQLIQQLQADVAILKGGQQ